MKRAECSAGRERNEPADGTGAEGVAEPKRLVVTAMGQEAPASEENRAQRGRAGREEEVRAQGWNRHAPHLLGPRGLTDSVSAAGDSPAGALQ